MAFGIERTHELGIADCGIQSLQRNVSAAMVKSPPEELVDLNNYASYHNWARVSPQFLRLLNEWCEKGTETWDRVVSNLLRICPHQYRVPRLRPLVP